MAALHGLALLGLWLASAAGDGPAQPAAATTTLVRVTLPSAPPVVGPAPAAVGPPLPAPPPAAPPVVAWLEPPPVALAVSPRPVAEPAPAVAPRPSAPTAAPVAAPAVAVAVPPAWPGPASMAPAVAAAPAPVAASPPPRRIGVDHRDCARAPYPAALRERGIEGELRVRVHVGPDGRAAEVTLLASSGWRLFDDAAMAQVRRCRFRPAHDGARAVAEWVEFPVRFALDG